MSARRPESHPRKESDRLYYLQNKERIDAKQREYYYANKEKILAQMRIRSARPLTGEELLAKRKRCAVNARRYYWSHRDKCNSGQRERYRKNPEIGRNRSRMYRAVNPNKVRESSSRYHKLNRERLTERHRQYYKENRQWFLDYAKSVVGRDVRKRAKAKRRAIENGCSISDQRLISAWQKRWLARKRVNCYWCSRSLSPKSCHSDHIIPLAKGGAHSIENLCISCKPCNSGKSASTLDVWNQRIYEPILI